MILLRSLVFNALFFPVMAIGAVLATPLLLAPRAWLFRVTALWARLVLWLLRAVCGVRVAVEGLSRIPCDGPALVASGHQSAFDTILWFALLPRPAYVLKRELLAIPFYGWIARGTGMLVVDREAGARAMRALLRDGKRAAAEGRQVVIFPEGTRAPPGQTLPFQPGVAALAAAMRVPVVPVATNSGLFWGRRSFAKRPGTIVVRALEPLDPRLPKDALLRELEARIGAEQARLAAA